MSETPDAFLKRQTGASRKFIKTSIILSYIASLFLIAQAALLAFIVNGVVFESLPLQAFALHLSFLLLFFTLRFVFLVFAERFAKQVSRNVEYELRQKLYAHIKNLGPVWIAGQSSGSLVNTLSDGVEAIGPYYSQYLPAKALMAWVPLTIVLCVFPADWISGLIMVGTAPLIPLFMILIGKGAEKLNQQQWRQLSYMSHHFLDMIQGLTALKIMGVSRRVGGDVTKIAEDYRRETMKVLRLAFLSSVTLEFFSTVSIAIVAVIIGFRLMWGDMSFLPGFFILLLAPDFYLPLRRMGAAYHARMEAIGAVEKIQEVMGTVPSHNISSSQKDLPEKLQRLEKMRFENVFFSYPDGRQALNGVSFEFKAGQKYALIGPSGAGKSTVISLLLGFIRPEQGKITVNDTEINQFDVKEWRKGIAWIPQNPTLFHGTVLENIRLGRQDIDEDSIKSLCHKLGVSEFIEKLPQGYNTLLGENGYGLSGGQAQRIAVARAFLREAPLLLMDEPTASLDHKTEEFLQYAIEELAKEKTVITIAHRLGTIKNADTILFLKEGILVAHGTHEELLQTNKNYSDLVSCELRETEFSSEREKHLHVS